MAESYIGRTTSKHLSGTRRGRTAAFKSRFVLLLGEIDHATARAACERLIALVEDSDAPMTVLISSPGGDVESGERDRRSDQVRVRACHDRRHRLGRERGHPRLPGRSEGPARVSPQHPGS